MVSMSRLSKALVEAQTWEPKKPEPEPVPESEGAGDRPLKKCGLHPVRLDDDVWLAIKELDVSLNRFLRVVLLDDDAPPSRPGRKRKYPAGRATPVEKAREVGPEPKREFDDI
jgi:hypothetical protein